jgi:regulator of protease activity HflC (stomatin/prohibitin superfamily)
MDLITILLSVLVILVIFGAKIVPQQQIWVVETLGKFNKTLLPGLSLIIPFVQKVAYKHSLKEQVIDVNQQTAITKDNVTLHIDGILYMRTIDPKAASYGVSDPHYALIQLAQTNMRSEIGKITLDKTFEERESLNANIVNSINEAAASWGIQCMRYEIKDIEPPETVLQAMELQVSAERRKRADVLESEGKRDAQINLAEGQKREVVLRSEAALTDQVNRAKGEAEAIICVAQATAGGLLNVAEALQEKGGSDAASLRIAEQYVEAFSKLAKDSTTLLLPADTGNASSMVAQAMSVFETIKGSKKAAKKITTKLPS